MTAGTRASSLGGRAGIMEYDAGLPGAHAELRAAEEWSDVIVRVGRECIDRCRENARRSAREGAMR